MCLGPEPRPASPIRRLNEKLDVELARSVFNARYERVGEDGVISNLTVVIAIGIDWESRRKQYKKTSG